MPKREVTVGIDIGGTTTGIGMVDAEGRLIAKKTIDTFGKRPFTEFKENLFREWESFFHAFQDEVNVLGIGAGAPNANYYKGTIENPPNLRWGFVNFVEELSNHFSLPVFITNDANAAAIGEKLFGAAKNTENFIEITLGTGLGSGIVSAGQVVYGHDGFAGELGHIIVQPEGRLCGCGNRGCLETYASATGIVRTFFKMLASENKESVLTHKSMDEITSKMIYEAAKAGDEIAFKTFEYTGKFLGRGMATAVTLFSPDLIVLFGGAASAGDLLIKPAIESLNNHVFAPFKDKVSIKISELPAGDAAILGASALAWNELQK
ncbi:MAG: ROK family protein [Calditrichia bacterium]